MEFEKITTDRLTLRILTPEVYDFIYQNFSEEELAKEKEKYGIID